MPPTISETELLTLIESGMLQKDVAATLGCSPAYVSKVMKKIRKRDRCSRELEPLSPEKRDYVLHRLSGKSKADAAAESFNVTTRQSAAQTGYAVEKAPDVQRALTEIMAEEGLSRRSIIRRLADHVHQEEDRPTSLKAVRLSAELLDLMPAAKIKAAVLHADVSPVDLSRYT